MINLGSISGRSFAQRAITLWVTEIMFNVYLLISLKLGKTYVGSTEKDVVIRLSEHNQGSNKWTKANGPFKLIYYESYYCKQDALHREKFLKSGVGNRVIKALTKEFNK